jgi:hypothetical protein
MAQATTLSFPKLKVELGDGATPTEVFAAPCGLNSRALNRSKNLNEVVIPDCDDEEAPAYVGRDVLSMTWSVTGEGVLAEEAVEAWEALWDSTLSTSVKVTEEFGTTTVVHLGKAHLATYNHGANRGEKASITIDLQGDGALVTTITP